MFEKLPLWLNIALFTVAAVAVWIAGTRVAGWADAIARKTGLGQAAVGLLLLAGVTSLPEIAVTVTAAVGNNPQLAVNNLLGSVALQVAILAVADAVIGKDALTSVLPDPVVLMQIALNMLILGVVAAAVVAGDHGVWGVGVWTILLFALYVASVWILTRSPGRQAWVIGGAAKLRGGAEGEGEGEGEGSGESKHEVQAEREQQQQLSLRALALRTAAGAAVILVAGFVLSRSGEVIATQTGLGQSMGGFLLVAISTSLPELSTVIASVRLGRYVMAVSDIFGTNLFNGGLLFVVDVFYRGGPVLNEVGPFAAFAALLGLAVSALFMIGLLERRDRTVLRMGYDSFATLLVYLGGVIVLFGLQ
jgi:cation:H+ antiporter